MPRADAQGRPAAPYKADGRSRPELVEALARLDMVAVVLFLDYEGDVMFSGTGDPDGELRRVRAQSKGEVEIASVLWTAGKPVAARLIGKAVLDLERAGIERRKRWVRVVPERAIEALYVAAAGIGCRLMTSGERLSLAVGQIEGGDG